MLHLTYWRNKTSRDNHGYIDLENDGKVCTYFCYCKVGDLLMNAPCGTYSLSLLVTPNTIEPVIRKDRHFFHINYVGDDRDASLVQIMEKCSILRSEERVSKMKWENLNREIYLALRDGKDAIIDIIDNDLNCSFL